MIDYFLIVIGVLWLIAAAIQDIKKREVENWLSFSLLAVALAYRTFYSLFIEWQFILHGLFGIAVFFAISYLLYYFGIFGGGDAKLLIALGAILPFFTGFRENLFFLAAFIFLMFAIGSVYGLIYSVFVIFNNKKKFEEKFLLLFRENKIAIFVSLSLSVLSLIVFALSKEILIMFFFIIFLFPLLYVYSKSADECMIKKIHTKQLTEGDWLYEQVKIKGKTLKIGKQGLDTEQVELIRKYKKIIVIKYGMPFVPVFLIAFVLVLFLLRYF